MNPLEQVGAVVLGLGALLGALTVVWKSSIVIGKHAWRALKAIGRWIVRFYKTVDVISDLPARLHTLEQNDCDKLQLLTEHISQADKDRKEIGDRLSAIEERQGIVVHEMQHNGGSSIKDDIKVLTSGLADLLHALDAAQTTGTFILPKREVQAKEPVLTGPVPLA